MRLRSVALALCAVALPAAAQPTLTLDQAMAHPDWIGPPVEDAWWRWDGKAAQYTLKRKGATIRDTWQVGIDGGVSGQGALQAAHAAHEAVDLIARLEASHADAELNDHPGQVHAEDRGKRVLRMGRCPGANLGVQRVDAAGGNAGGGGGIDRRAVQVRAAHAALRQ